MVGIIDENIHPCKGCEDFEPPKGCKSKGGCAPKDIHVKMDKQADGDLISRQAAIKAIDERAKRIKNEDTLNGLAGAVGILFELPSVNPQEPQEISDRNLKMWEEIYAEEKRRERSEEGAYCKDCVNELAMQDIVKRKAGTPREDYEPLYNCEDWIP